MANKERIYLGSFLLPSKGFRIRHCLPWTGLRYPLSTLSRQLKLESMALVYSADGEAIQLDCGYMQRGGGGTVDYGQSYCPETRTQGVEDRRHRHPSPRVSLELWNVSTAMN